MGSGGTGERDLRVRIGSMIHPDEFWLIRYRKSDELTRLEQDLDLFLPVKIPSVESIVPDVIVGLKHDGEGHWKRARAVTPIAKFLSGSQARFFLLDYGVTTDYVPIKNLRILPEPFLTRLKPQAKEIKVILPPLSSLLPPKIDFSSTSKI